MSARTDLTIEDYKEALLHIMGPGPRTTDELEPVKKILGPYSVSRVLMYLLYDGSIIRIGYETFVRVGEMEMGFDKRAKQGLTD